MFFSGIGLRMLNELLLFVLTASCTSKSAICKQDISHQFFWPCLQHKCV